MSNYVDLSVLVTNDTPVYPGDPDISIKPFLDLDKDGANVTDITMNTHVGTHIDAPSHMVKDGKALDQIPLDTFIGRGRYIKLKNKKFDLSLFENADIREGDIVIIDTGHAELYGKSNDYFENFTEVPEEVAKFLIEKKIKIVGFDLCAPDNYPDYPIHKLFLQNEILIIENLVNLGSLEDQDFEIIAFPMRLDLDGAPTRVIAKFG